jgi:VWFA-related protein
MSRRVTLFGTLLVILIVTAHFGASARGPQQKGQQGAFRTNVVLVPLDVRVVDKAGKPVTDLKQEDFSVFEDDVRQTIGHFEKRELASEAPQPGSKWAVRDAAFSISPQSNRIFMLVLGRGKLQEPSKALDALLTFVRERLMPQDRIALFTYDRATPFTTDHEVIARVIERFKKTHADIDMEVGFQMAGLASVYGSRMVPRSVQSKIDALFEGLIATNDLGQGPPGKLTKAEADARRQTDALQRTDIENMSKTLNDPTLGLTNLSTYSTHDEIENQLFTDLPLDEFIDRNGQTLQDLGNLYAAIEYMRHFEGEKHIVYVTEKGLALPRFEEDERLWRTANDARVVIDTFQTGGIYIGQEGGKTMASWSETFSNQTLRNVAEQTGGIASIMESGQWMIDRLDAATRAGYVIGYYPSNARWDGSYRKITVKVNRPDATVLYRRGYYGRPEIAPFDRRTFITTERILSALNYASGGREIKDIKLKLNASYSKGDLAIELNIDASRLAFTTVNGVHMGLVDIAVFAGDANGNVLGNSLQKAELKLAEEQFQAIKKNGVPYRLHMQLPTNVRSVKVIVYDYASDLVGTAEARVL